MKKIITLAFIAVFATAAQPALSGQPGGGAVPVTFCKKIDPHKRVCKDIRLMPPTN